MAASIGIMDSAYFVSKSDLLAWLNNTLQLNICRVEEASVTGTKYIDKLLSVLIAVSGLIQLR